VCKFTHFPVLGLYHLIIIIIIVVIISNNNTSLSSLLSAPITTTSHTGSTSTRWHFAFGAVRICSV